MFKYVLQLIFLFIWGQKIVGGSKKKKSDNKKVSNIKVDTKKSNNNDKNKNNNIENKSFIEMIILERDKRKIAENKNTTRIFNVGKLKEKCSDNSQLKKKYDDRSKLDINAKDIVDDYKIFISKEINISSNKGMFEKEGLLTEKIFDAIKEEKLNAFSDVNLRTKINYKNLKERLVKPVLITGRRRKKSVRQFFSNSDVDNIEIIGNIIWSRLLPNKILDYLVVKISVPTHKSKLESDITVCYINYDDFINYISNEKIMAKTSDGVVVHLADAIVNDKLNVMYTSILDNDNEYQISDADFKENNFCASKLINELENKFYSYNDFLQNKYE